MDGREEFVFEDISSSSAPRTGKKIKAAARNYGNGIFRMTGSAASDCISNQFTQE